MLKTIMCSRRMLVAVLLGAIPWIAYGDPFISTINVSPLPLSPGNNFAVQVQASDVTAGQAYVDFRPAAPTLLRLTLTQSGGSWNVSGTVPNMVLNSATTASVQVIMTKGALRATQTIRVPLQDPRPALVITSPTNLATINSNLVTVVGTARALNPVIQVNGVNATVANGAFSASVPVNEGNSVITAVGTDGLGKVTTAAIQVTVDTEPPRLTIDSPANGAILSEPLATVTGTINDTVIGTINGDQATVTVNGTAATIANRTYVVMNIPLVPGLNTITAIGTDRVGNRGTNAIQVTYNPSIAAHVQLVSGDAQSAQINELLPQPLVARAVDANGNPVPDKKVIFKVTQNDGLVIGPTDTARSLIVMSGPDGLAQVQFRLGNRAGAGNNQVSASIVGFKGEAMFCASATPGPAGLLVPDAGNNQVGVAGQRLPSPLISIVVDSGHNRLRNVPITYTVKEGGGKLGSGLTSMTVNTDGDGRATAVLTLGPDAGNDNNIVEASFPGNTGFPAIFVASARIPGDLAETSISGVVLDNSDVPVPGATMRLVGYPNAVQSDANGFFQIKPAPVGAVRLIADGTTVTRPGTWVWLQFNMVTIAGQDNDIGRPVRLLPIDPGSGMHVDATHGGTLTLAKAPGYSLTIAPNSVTFPDGTKSGTVSVTVVHPDKMPDPPSFGQQPRFLVSIQPANAIFNPPAAMCLPNLDGLPPGQKTDMYSYDHDLERFVSIGTGTVSEDGMTLCSDPGNGVIKAGWHCGGNPAAAGSGAKVKVTVSPTECVLCKNDVVVSLPNTAKEVMATASGSPSPPATPAYTWSGGGGKVKITPTQSQNGTTKIEPVAPGQDTVTVKYTCKSGQSATADLKVKVLHHQTLKFYDQPKRFLTGGAKDWQATLQLVSQSAAGSSTYTALNSSVTYGFKIDASGNVTTYQLAGASSINITQFDVYNDGTYGGLTIQATVEGCAEHSLRWVQTITTTDPLGGCTSPYNDPCPGDDTLPYYYTDAELPGQITEHP